MIKDNDVNAFELFVPPQTRPLRQNVENLQVFNKTRKTKLVLCIEAMWTAWIPPYNLARLAGITKGAGYDTKIFDFNINGWVDFQKQFDRDMWSSTAYHLWQDSNIFHQEIFNKYKPWMDKNVQTILDENPDIVGFTLYATNRHPTQYITKRLKELKPDITVIWGGPECNEQGFQERFTPDLCDNYFVGESEQNLLYYLEDFEKGNKWKDPRIGGLYGKKRINIDSLPYPDYSDFSFHKYKHNQSCTTEFSRGCVARCAYCSEVWYWKFRDRDAIAVVDEMEHQYKTYGTRFFFFADSLMNGNMKEFKKFVIELANRKKKKLIDLHWFGYIRADGRMDLDLYKTIKASGATGFNYGFESGSQKVLDAVNKNITVEEMNQNLKDAEKAGVASVALWIIGAPGEDHEANGHSLNFLWNHRNRIKSIAPGTGLWDNRGTLYDDRKRFNLSERDWESKWFGGWWTLDGLNTRVHRHIRIKLTHIWIDIINKFRYKLNPLENSHRIAGDLTEHYKFIYDPAVWLDLDDLEYEYNFNFRIINTDNDFADSVMNEIWPFLRMLWRTIGEFGFSVTFDTMGLDAKHFDYNMNNEWDYFSDINFAIDKDGHWNAIMKFKLDDRGPFKNDGSFDNTFTGNGKW